MIDPLPNQDTLLAVYEGQRAESLQHRQSIFNAFSVSLAGLLAIAVGVAAQDHLEPPLKWTIAIAVFIVWVSIFIFIRSQRAESEKAMDVMRKIESNLKLFEEDAFISKDTVLPPDLAVSPTLILGMKKADRFLVGSLAFVTIGVWFLLYFMA